MNIKLHPQQQQRSAYLAPTITTEERGKEFDQLTTPTLNAPNAKTDRLKGELPKAGV